MSSNHCRAIVCIEPFNAFLIKAASGRIRRRSIDVHRFVATVCEPGVRRHFFGAPGAAVPSSRHIRCQTAHSVLYGIFGLTRHIRSGTLAPCSWSSINEQSMCRVFRSRFGWRFRRRATNRYAMNRWLPGAADRSACRPGGHNANIAHAAARRRGKSEEQT